MATQHARRTRAVDHEQIDRASDAIKETINEIRDRSDDVKATVKEYVNEKPFKALGIAALSGMALALLLRR